MGLSKEKAFNSAKHSPNANLSSDIFQVLLLAVEAPEGIKPPLLKSLYYLLIHLSYDGADLTDMDIGICELGIRVTFKDICGLSDILFKELSKRFDMFLSTFHDVSTIAVLGQASLHLDICADAEKLNLLLRCCMVVLNLLVPRQNLLLENGQVLLLILERLNSLSLAGTKDRKEIGFQKSVSLECIYNGSNSTTLFLEDVVASFCFLEPSVLDLPFLSAMLEVFADELLLHGKLRAFFKLIDSVSSSSQLLFIRSSSHGDMEIVMELISTHFCLSLSQGQGFENFLTKLFLLDGKDFRVPDICLTAAMSLLLNPVIPSMPKLLQAHLISLVSNATIVGMGFENVRPGFRLVNCYLSAFERSVILYTKHMSHLPMGSHPTGGGSFAKSGPSVEDFQESFESYILPDTRKKINDLIVKLDNSWTSYVCDMLSQTKSNLITSSIAYIRENQLLLDKSCRDDIVSILSCMILRASNDNYTELTTNRNTSSQDLCLLAAILKLMGSSLLQAVWCLRNSGDLDSLKILKNFSSHKEYDSIVASISCFKEFDLSLPIQKFLRDMMETHQMMHKESKLMLFHLSGLLSLSFASGLDFVVKGCILTMMALLNLFVFEEGNLDVLKSLIDSRSGSFSTGLALVNIQEAVVVQKSSIVAASKFHKIQSLYLSSAPLEGGCTGREDGHTETLTRALVPANMERATGIEEEIEEACNGEIFLKCMLNSTRPSDFDDLVDFIECKRGKDYSSWLKDRQRYRKWKFEKMEVLRWKKKKRILKLTKAKRV